MNAAAVQWPLTIYYDRSCPLCAAEMHALIAHDPAGRLQLIDCSAPGFADADANAAEVSVQQMFTLIHARDAAGSWFKGVEVFVLAYQAVGLDAIASLWSHRKLRPLWDRLYPWIARHRMGLSRLGLAPAYGWLVTLAARRAVRRARPCDQGACALPPADQ